MHLRVLNNMHTLYRLQNCLLKIAWHVLNFFRCSWWNILAGDFIHTKHNMLSSTLLLEGNTNRLLYSWLCRVLDAFSVKFLLQVPIEIMLFISFLQWKYVITDYAFLQLIVFFLCHPSWEVRKMSHDATRKIINSLPQLSEALLTEFTKFLSVVGEKIFVLKTR